MQRSSANRWQVKGTISIRNPHPRMEVFVPKLNCRPAGAYRSSNVNVRCSLTPQHPDEHARSDGYWFAYIVKGRKTTQAEALITLEANDEIELRQLLDTLWLEILWINYGPFGRLQQRDGVLIPLRRPAPAQGSSDNWRQGDRCSVLPIRTHLLGTLDDPAEVLRHYAGAVLQPGDVLTIGETPLAVMQGRYNHPAISALKPPGCSRLPSHQLLATACGLQTLIDNVGPARVLCAGSRAPPQAGGLQRLVLPAGRRAGLSDRRRHRHHAPYDQTIVLGPVQSEVCPTRRRIGCRRRRCRCQRPGQGAGLQSRL